MHALLDAAHYQRHGVWRLKPVAGRPPRKLKVCHLRIVRTAEEATDVFRLSHQRCPQVLLAQLGRYWVIPSVTSRQEYVYLSRTQLRQLDPQLWTITSYKTTTRHQWRQVLRRAINKS